MKETHSKSKTIKEVKENQTKIKEIHRKLKTCKKSKENT